MLPPAVRMLLTINVVLFVLWIPLSFSPAINSFFHQHLTLQTTNYQAFKEPWQFITYNFLHIKGSEFQGLIALAVSMMFLVVVGRDYEEMHGSHRLFAVYLIGGIGGGILAITLESLFPGLNASQNPDMPLNGHLMVAGSMGAVLAVLMTVAILHPYKSVGLLLIGPVKLLYLVLGYLILDMFLFSRGQGAVIYAHCGGALFGFLFAKAESSSIDLSSWALYFFPRSSSSGGSSSGRSGQGEGFLSRLESWLAAKKTDEPKRPARPRPTKERTWRRAEAEVEIVETSIENEVDRILDKISEEGYDSLTAEEKRILYEASKR